MVGGLQSGRSPAHLARLIDLARDAGVLPGTDQTDARIRAWKTTVGWGR
jgi:hypothetical protein